MYIIPILSIIIYASFAFKAIVSGCWIFSVALNMPLFLATRFDASINDCKWNWPAKWIGAAYDSVWLVLSAVIPLAIMTVLYSKVVYMLWFKRNEENEVTRQQKVGVNETFAFFLYDTLNCTLISLVLAYDLLEDRCIGAVNNNSTLHFHYLKQTYSVLPLVCIVVSQRRHQNAIRI